MCFYNISQKKIAIDTFSENYVHCYCHVTTYKPQLINRNKESVTIFSAFPTRVFRWTVVKCIYLLIRDKKE